MTLSVTTTSIYNLYNYIYIYIYIGPIHAVKQVDYTAEGTIAVLSNRKYTKIIAGARVASKYVVVIIIIIIIIIINQ